MKSTVNDVRRIFAVSGDELERRWLLLREHMNAADLDAAVCVASDPHLSGYSRWLTDSPYAYRRAVMFFRDGPMTLIDHGRHGFRRRHGPDTREYPGVGEIITVGEFPSVHYTQTYEADLVLRVLAEKGCRRIGLVGIKSMPHAFAAALESGFRGDVVDVTEYVDHCKAIKSREEIGILRRCAAIQDAIFHKLLTMIRPGMRDCEVAAAASYISRGMGCESGAILAGSAPPDKPAHMLGEHMQGRTICAGDVVCVLIENAPLDGYFVELTRSVCLGQAPSELLERFEQMRKAQEYTLSLLKPGAAYRTVHELYNEYMVSQGQEGEERIFAHGQGYDLVERPLVRRDETMVVERGHCLAIHPSVLTDSAFAVVCDNYLIGDDGPGNCLHQTEKKVFEI